MEDSEIKLIQELQAELSITRKQIMDYLELAYGREPEWIYVRAKILNHLGRSGLEGVLARGIEKRFAKIGKSSR